MSDDQLSTSVHRLRLAAVAHEVLEADPDTEVADRARRALAACGQIEARTTHEEGKVTEIAQLAGIAVTSDPPPQPRQNHAIRLRVADNATAHRLADVLSDHGYVQWEQLAGGALRSFDRTASWLTVAQTTDVTVVVRISWREAPRRGTMARIFGPTAGDWHMIDLPGWAWPAYSVVRPVRLVVERLGWRRRYASGLGPFLSTPDSLIPPLLGFADVGPGDFVVDLGCGDGRIVIEAAARLGCDGHGVDTDQELVRRGQQRAADRSIAARVKLSVGDARTVDLESATVVFAFLPVDVIAELLPELLQRMRRGARLVVHEQSALTADTPKPDETQLVVSGDAVTVARRWTVA